MHRFHLQLVAFVEFRNDDMRVGAWSPGPNVRLILASVVDELLQGGDVGRLTDHERHMSCRHTGNEHEIPVGVVRQTFEEDPVLRQSRVGGDQQRITIRRRLLHGCRTDRTAGACLVLDNHGLAELLGEIFAVEARKRVHESTGWIAANDFYGSGRPFLRPPAIRTNKSDRGSAGPDEAAASDFQCHAERPAP